MSTDDGCHSETVTRSRTISEGTSVTRSLWKIAEAIFEEWATTNAQPVRLLGFSLAGFDGPAEDALFNDPSEEKAKRVDAATDRILERFGAHSISRAQSVRRGDRR